MWKQMVGYRDLHINHPDWDDGLFVEVRVRYTEWPDADDEQGGWEIQSIETVDSGSLVKPGTETWRKFDAEFSPASRDQEDNEDWV